MPSEDAKTVILNRCEVRGEQVGRSFFAALQGESFPNSDGTSRQEIIARCSQLEELVMTEEPENVHDQFAVKVVTKHGEQVGYLDSRLAREVGSGWRCYVASINGGAGSKPQLGITLLMVAPSCP